MEQEYTNFAHDILQRVGKRVLRSVQDVAKEIEAGESKSLEQFVADKTDLGYEVWSLGSTFDKDWRKNLNDLFGRGLPRGQRILSRYPCT